MANGRSSDPEIYVLRSGVRSGLKREFAFALKSQADFPKSNGRTRSGKVLAPADSPFRGKKRHKKSDVLEDQETNGILSLDSVVLPTILQEPFIGVSSAPSGGIGEELSITDTGDERSFIRDVDIPIISESIEGMGKDVHSLDALVEADCNNRLEESISKEKPVENSKKPIPKVKIEVSENILLTSPLSSSPLEPVTLVQEMLMNNEEVKDKVSLLENESLREHSCVSKSSNTPIFDNRAAERPFRRFTRSALKVIPDTADTLTIEHEENPVVVMPVSATSLTVEQEENLVEVPIILDGHGGLEFENGYLEGSMKAEIVGPVSVTIVTLSNEENDMDETGCVAPLENPARWLTTTLPQAATDASKSTSVDSVESEDLKDAAGALSKSLRMTPKNKMELKMSKKITLTKLPANVRDLLGTGLLEGLPVKYISCIGKNVGLYGVIRGNGILCSCISCQGTNVVSAYQFEIHAGSTKKHPSDFIFLENGKSLREVLKSCTGASLDMLEAAIQNAICPTPPKKDCVCQKCKEVFDTAHTGNFALLCNSCLEATLRTAATTSSYGMTSSAKLPRKFVVRSATVVKPSAFDEKHKNPSSQKKTSYGKLTRKDLGLHKLVFMDDILPQGTEVGYYVRGKRLLEGYIKDSGIFCSCCNSVVSPSQFEAHAGQSSRRKPYNYIYTSNGVSLHELSVSLSKGRKFSSTENDDLCGICADGGDLLLCDLCPRAFHKECMGLSVVPNGNWYCQYCENMHQKEKHLALNDNAIAAGRVAGVDPIEQIITRCIRIVNTTENDAGVCALCRQFDFTRSGFDQRTVIICDQCETEYHVGCLKDNCIADLKELPEGEWFCRPDCRRIHSTLHELLLQGHEVLDVLDADIIKRKLCEKGLSKDAAVDVRCRLLSGKNDSPDSKLLLSQAVTIFRESFDPIVEPISGRDLIPFMVYCLNMRDQDFGGMYCMVLTVNSSVISAGLLRVLGCEIAELPIVATKMESRGLGFFQSLLSCIERLFKSLKVKHFVLPAAGDAESIWTNKLGFSKITTTQLRDYAKGVRPMSFQGTSMLHKSLLGQHEPALAADDATTVVNFHPSPH